MPRKSIEMLIAAVVLTGIGCGQDSPSVPVAEIAAVARDVPHPPGSWPRWGGPAIDLISRETGWVSHWPDTGPKLAWKANVGVGFSSVAVTDGRLYTMGHRDGRDVVSCLDAATGNEVWKYSYTCALVDNLHEGGPGATPTVDADRVYTLSREGHLFGFDRHSGQVVWSQSLEDELGVSYPQWGFTSSPLVLDDKVIVDGGPTVAFDKLNGQQIWQTQAFQPGYGSPTVFSNNGQQLIAVLNNDGLLVIKAHDGQHVAFQEWQTDYATSSTTPIIHGDTIFISTGYGQGCALFRFDGNTLKTVYENRQIRNHMANCVLWDGYLYGIDGQSSNSGSCRLVCMAHADGNVAWTERGFGCGTLLISDGKLIVLSDDGILATAEATPGGYHEISRARVLEGRCWTVPVLAGHRIYCRNATGDLVCVDVAEGS